MKNGSWWWWEWTRFALLIFIGLGLLQRLARSVGKTIQKAAWRQVTVMG